MASFIQTKKLLVLSQDAQACHAITSALSKKYSIYATACEREGVNRFIHRMKPDVVLCDLDLLRAVAASAGLGVLEQLRVEQLVVVVVLVLAELLVLFLRVHVGRLQSVCDERWLFGE